MSENVIYSINGPVVKVKNAKDFSMLEMVYVGHAKLMGEVISISNLCYIRSWYFKKYL